MIEKLEIRNFSTNKKLDIEFGPRVTSIIGKSFLGKSAFIRALKWVILNRPAGNSFINWDTNKTAVRLSFDGKRVTRKKGAGVNSYKYSRVKESYKAFGNEVPPAISEALNLSDINFQGQHEPPFWFCKTAGEVSRQLNNIVNLEVIDSTLFNIASELRKTKTTIEITEEKLSKTIERKKELVYIKELNQDLINIETLQKQIQEKAVGCRRIGELLKSMELYGSKRENTLNLILGGKNPLSKGQICLNITNQVQNLSKLVEGGQELQRIKKPPSLIQIKILKTEVEESSIQCGNLSDLIETITSNEEKKCQTEEDLKISQEEFGKVVGDKCPLCGRPLKEKL